MAEGEQPDRPPQYKLEDILNVGEIQQQLSSVFIKTFREAEQAGIQAFKNIAKEAASVKKAMGGEAGQTSLNLRQMERFRRDFDRKRMSAEKFKLDQLLLGNKKLLDNVKKIHRDEKVSALKEAETLSDAKKKIAELQKKQDKENADFRNKQIIAERAARIAAGEGTFGDRAARGMDILKKKTEDWKKSLLDTKTWWEVIMVSLVIAASQVSDIAKTQAGLRRAGLAGTAGLMGGLMGFGGEGEEQDVGRIRKKALGGVLEEMPLASAERAQILTTLAGAPKIIEELDKKGGAALKSFIGKMGDMGHTIHESTQIAAEASQLYNFSLEETNRIYDQARGIADSTNLEFDGVFKNLLQMTGQLRQVSFSADTAAQVLGFAEEALAGLGFSNTEVQNFASTLAQALGQLKPSNLTGLLAFKNARFPTRTQIIAAMDDPTSVLIGSLKKMADQVKKGSIERLLAVEKIAEKYLPGLTGKGIVALEATLDTVTAKSLQDLKDKFPTDAKKAAQIEQEGFQTLKDMRGPLQVVEDTMKTLGQSLTSVFIPVMTQLLRILPLVSAWLAKRVNLPSTPVDIKLTLEDLHRPSTIQQMMQNVPISTGKGINAGRPENSNTTHMTK